MNYAFLNHTQLDKRSAVPLFIQLRDVFRNAITNGVINGGMKLPSSRMLSEHFDVNRQTVVAAMEELAAEGWIKSDGRKGMFVNEKLPFVKPVLLTKANAKKYPASTGFSTNTKGLQLTKTAKPALIGFDDGYPDVRIAPIKELGRAYMQSLNDNSKVARSLLRNPVTGSTLLRDELATLMSTYRGMPISANNILVTQGSQMSIFLTASLVINKGDNVVVTNPNYQTSNFCFVRLGANIVKVGVDEHGMCVDELERVCKKKKIRCIYVTSHHHHPTTVTLSIERRLKLLQLAERYGFIIIEDDYDYDFHYENRPLMPIASNDTKGHVIYIGSFSKILSHNFRVGYVIAPENFIHELTAFRKLVDRQGDPILENAIGILLRDGVIKNHIRKALNIYRQRRDDAYELLAPLSKYMQFSKPQGGLAFWSIFDNRVSLPELSKRCAAKGVYFSDGQHYNYEVKEQNGCRLGFASMNSKEMQNSVEVLKSEISKMMK